MSEELPIKKIERKKLTPEEKNAERKALLERDYMNVAFNDFRNWFQRAFAVLAWEDAHELVLKKVEGAHDLSLTDWLNDNGEHFAYFFDQDSLPTRREQLGSKSFAEEMREVRHAFHAYKAYLETQVTIQHRTVASQNIGE